MLDRAVYVVVNRDCDRLLSLSMEDVREAPVIEKVTSYSKG